MSLRLLLSLCLLSAACGDDDPAPTPDAGPLAASRAATVQELARDVILPAYRQFAAEAAALEAAITAWAASGAEADHEAARVAWRSAMGTWQQVEVMLVGPAGAMGPVIGGEDMRDAIYSWPIVNACRVDQELVSQDYADVDAFAAKAVNVQGLDALEYLLFYEASANACAPNSSINSMGLWTPIVGELPARRAAMSRTVATLLVRAANALVARWDDSFFDAMTSAGSGSALFPTAQEALNALSDALFYVDKEVKDMKLADPMGLSTRCVGETCPELRESLYAARSIPNVLDNLRGTRLIYAGAEGGTGRGFDDLLRELGADQLADDFLGAIDAAIALAEGIEDDVPAILAADPDGLDPLYDAVKAITDILKTQFLAVLDLELPRRAEGDND